MTQAVVTMIAGPNGAGKTTAALKLLPEFLSLHEFVNADEIAKGLNPLNPYGQPVAAGRVMLQRIDELICEKKSFAFESTGSSQVFLNKIRQAKDTGYKFKLVFLWLPSVQVAKNRVRWRVAQGGHDVPEQDIERRFIRCLINLVVHYLPLADEAAIYDSSRAGTGRQDIIAEKRESYFNIYQHAIWQDIETAAKEGMHG